ncbi:MAG: hypothetical protein ABIS20_03115 [Thermoanaerobaculia bacterium]
MDRLYEWLAQWRSASALFFLGLLIAVSTAAPVLAGACSLDDRPGATLLLPYFEVDLDNPLGRTTLFSVNNASAAAVLVNVVVWTDLGVPTLNFPIYLTGYDVQTINLRDVFAGHVPGTASDTEDPNDTISPQGQYSQDLGFPGCAGALPPGVPPAGFLEHLQASHTGRVSPITSACAGQRFNDRVARGYVTMDTVSRCGFLTPRDAGYFGAGGVATNQNVLWGDFFYADTGRAFVDGENLVRLKADPAAFGAGSQTFYGRYVGGSGADARQPLPRIWAARFASFGLSPDDGTDLVVWRDSGRIVQPFPCGQPPAWYPLLAQVYQAFDEQEQALIYEPPPVATPPPPPRKDQLPAEANRFTVGYERFSIPFEFGWIFLDLGLPENAQSWVGVVMKAQGRFSVGFGATPLANGCPPPIIPSFN